MTIMACNPTVQYDDFTGDGQTTAYTFTFPYDNKTDVQVRLGTYPNYTYPAYTTEYSVDAANPTIVNFVTAPSGPIRIFRCTPNNVLPATFQAGSAIRSSDLNNNFNQILFVSQDSSIRSAEAQSTADIGYTFSQTAIDTANDAVDTANATIATANAANATANTTAAALANAIFYDPYADVASIPSSPSNNDYIEITNSTGIESFTPLAGLPSGFVGEAALTVRLRYLTSNSSWNWVSYYANDPETRYLKVAPFLESPQTISTSKVIAANTNAGLMGPTVTIASGVNITVGANSQLTVLT